VLEARVLELQDRHPLGGWQLVGGALSDDEGTAIYLIDGISAVDVARAFGTGSHQVDQTQRVCDELARVYEVAPFRPYYADAAGYNLRAAAVDTVTALKEDGLTSAPDSLALYIESLDAEALPRFLRALFQRTTWSASAYEQLRAQTDSVDPGGNQNGADALFSAAYRVLQSHW